MKKDKTPLAVKRSKTGLGLFALTSFGKGDLIIEYTGELISSAEADRRGGKYLFDLNKRWTIDGKGRSNTARYINHSCKPNSEAEIDGKRIFIYAIRRIEPGEEITYDYGKEYVAAYIAPLGCKCASCSSRS